jgi:hypothetical protein
MTTGASADIKRLSSSRRSSRNRSPRNTGQKVDVAFAVVEFVVDVGVDVDADADVDDAPASGAPASGLAPQRASHSNDHARGLNLIGIAPS